VGTNLAEQLDLNLKKYLRAAGNGSPEVIRERQNLQMREAGSRGRKTSALLKKRTMRIRQGSACGRAASDIQGKVSHLRV
jgi:hypothetical protein